MIQLGMIQRPDVKNKAKKALMKRTGLKKSLNLQQVAKFKD